jgi:hypothetical protein
MGYIVGEAANFGTAWLEGRIKLNVVFYGKSLFIP